MKPTAVAKIILAEDDNDMRRFLVKALEKAGRLKRLIDGATATPVRSR